MKFKVGDLLQDEQSIDEIIEIDNDGIRFVVKKIIDSNTSIPVNTRFKETYETTIKRYGPYIWNKQLNELLDDT